MLWICCVAGAAASAILTVAPIGTLTIWLLFLLAVESRLIHALLPGRRPPPVTAVPPASILDGAVIVQLRRRTEPGLRARRPFGVVEQQVRWRLAAEARRRARGV